MLARLSKRLKKTGPADVKGWQEKQTIDGQPYYFNDDTMELSWEKPFELLSKAEQEDGQGSWVWVPHPTNIWQAAKIIKDNGETVQVKTEGGKKVSVLREQVMCDQLTGGRAQLVPLWDLNYSSLRRPEEDLVMLDSHNEAMLINTLRLRYESDDLYTWVGAARTVLISVNPYKNVSSLYGSEQIDLHANRPPNKPLPPHVYDIADGSYRDLVYAKQNQSILISGESGAGKTVCTKQCLEFLANVAGSDADVEEKVILANPLLEAFGNAQTLRNNNSSRFGKYINIHFDGATGVITAASITNYLLEKSRVVYQQEGERNYHVFYQMCTHPATRAKLGLDDASSYTYLTRSSVMLAKDIDDKDAHDEVLEAMSVLNFSEDDQDFVLNLTAGVLTLGNIEFAAIDLENGVTGSKIVDSTPLQAVASYLKVSVETLEHVLCHRSISVRGKTDTIPLDPAAARKACDSLAMGIYARLFIYLVEHINLSLEGDETNRTIGILDIYGFEVFEQNSFEQLLINFTNEALQQQFNHTTFTEEEKVYESEGIDFQHVEYKDSQVVLDLIQGRPHGILLMIDDEIRIPEGSEAAFMNKIETMYKRHPKFQTDKHRRLENSLSFEIAHYAGVVKYNADGFMEKNTDTLFQDAYDMLASSEFEAISELFPELDGRRQLVSLSTQFRRSLNSLMETLDETNSRYIRCIKPNDEQLANQFQAGRVIEQLRYSGVFEAVEIRSRGFPFRLSYAVFACRYSCINMGHRYKNKDDEEDLVREILSTSKQDFSDVRFGRTLVLYRAPEYKLLELMRNLALETIIPKQQAAQRGHLAREFRRRCLAAQREIQDALDVGNDIDMLDAAIANVEPTIGTFRTLFPNGQPANLKEAIAHRANLAKWKALEARLEGLVTQDPNKVYYELAKAVDEGKSLMHIPQTPRQRELIEEAIQLRENSDLGKIDAACEEVIANLYREELEDLSARSKRLGHRTPQIDEINRLLRLPEIEYVQLELEVAKKQHDRKREIHREIRYEELFLEANEGDFANIGGLESFKDPEEFAKFSVTGMAKLFGNKQKRMETMFTWTKAAPATPLTAAVEFPEKPLLKDFVNALKAIRRFAGDAKSPEPDADAASFLAYLKNASSPELVDELYLQLVKQCNENPTPESTLAYYDLIGLSLECRLPSEDLRRYLLVFVKATMPDTFHYKNFTSAIRNTQYDRATSISAGQVAAEREKFHSTVNSRYSYKRPGVEDAGDDDEE
ncbi:Myosin-1 [Hondaea fermentalgiana]|uniref:Myosin-1 n=1 Tax=Hondaea fermentalgiana TaxID=2315210 RepID=A0A2R5H2A2_9STRA|nr:Myosin-1 [Hondaea fermentalgiana]|eukprot:GBG34514.1 Myosin-1 [Hondaea fermentalgiana]